MGRAKRALGLVPTPPGSLEPWVGRGSYRAPVALGNGASHRRPQLLAKIAKRRPGKWPLASGTEDQ